MASVERELSLLPAQPLPGVLPREDACLILKEACYALQQFLISYTFLNQEEEIHFFKCLKPDLHAKLIYYTTLRDLEHHCPPGSVKAKKKYWQKALHKLRVDVEDQKAFNRYYRSKATYHDALYFTRHSPAFNPLLDAALLDVNPTCSTGYDLYAARLLANDLLQAYLAETILSLHSTRLNPLTDNRPSPCPWTAPKSALIELIYALHSAGALAHGKVELKDMAAFFEAHFDIELGNIYHAFLELRNRKTGRTKFLDTLKQDLMKRMDGYDG